MAGQAQIATIDNWSVETRSSAISNLQFHAGPTSAPAGSSTRNRISLDATFDKENAPIALKVVPDASPYATNLTFLLDPTLINHTGFDIVSANISLIDGPTTPSNVPQHSTYAHFHDTAVFANWENPTIGSFESYFSLNNTTGGVQNINGANDIRLSGGVAGGIDSGASVKLKGYGIHQFISVDGPAGNYPSPVGSPAGNGGAFYIVLTSGGVASQNGQFDQVLEGDDGDNTLVGDVAHFGNPIARNDLIFGYGGNDNIVSGLGNDTVVGGDGDDTIETDQGNNYILGGKGIDTAVFNAPRASFVINDSLFVDFTISGANSFDAVTDVECFKFSDVTLTAADLISGVPSNKPAIAAEVIVGTGSNSAYAEGITPYSTDDRLSG